MSDFRKLLLAFAAVTILAGIASAQASPPGTVLSTTAAPLTVRTDGDNNLTNPIARYPKVVEHNTALPLSNCRQNAAIPAINALFPCEGASALNPARPIGTTPTRGVGIYSGSNNGNLPTTGIQTNVDQIPLPLLAAIAGSSPPVANTATGSAYSSSPNPTWNPAALRQVHTQGGMTTTTVNHGSTATAIGSGSHASIGGVHVR